VTAARRRATLEIGRCRDCVDYAPSGRPEAWGACDNVAAKHGVYKSVVEPMAVRADFGCIHWREVARP
jgi:hypothetical protein